MTQKTELNQLINKILNESDFRRNPYLTALTDGELTKDDFVETQIQFLFAVRFFSRPMAALAAKIPSPELRVEVIRNVWEEHGEGDVRRIHGTTFMELLMRLNGVTPEDVERRALWPEVRAFNTVLTGACVLDEYMTGVGLMGMIERMFVEISAIIGAGIVERGWLSEDKLIHYSLHKDLDIKHSEDFFDILERAWGVSPENQYAIEQGLRLGNFVFNRMYEDLYRARARREVRAIRGPHSRAEG